MPSLRPCNCAVEAVLLRRAMLATTVSALCTLVQVCNMEDSHVGFLNSCVEACLRDRPQEAYNSTARDAGCYVVPAACVDCMVRLDAMRHGVTAARVAAPWQPITAALARRSL